MSNISLFTAPCINFCLGIMGITGIMLDQMQYLSTVVSPVSVRPQFPCTHSFVKFLGSKE